MRQAGALDGGQESDLGAVRRQDIVLPRQLDDWSKIVFREISLATWEAGCQLPSARVGGQRGSTSAWWYSGSCQCGTTARTTIRSDAPCPRPGRGTGRWCRRTPRRLPGRRSRRPRVHRACARASSTGPHVEELVQPPASAGDETPPAGTRTWVSPRSASDRVPDLRDATGRHRIRFHRLGTASATAPCPRPSARSEPGKARSTGHPDEAHVHRSKRITTLAPVALTLDDAPSHNGPMAPAAPARRPPLLIALQAGATILMSLAIGQAGLAAGFLSGSPGLEGGARHQRLPAGRP